MNSTAQMQKRTRDGDTYECGENNVTTEQQKRLKIDLTLTDGASASTVLQDVINLPARKASPCSSTYLRDIRKTRFTVQKCTVINTSQFRLSLKQGEKDFTLDVSGRWCDDVKYDEGASISVFPCEKLLETGSDSISTEDTEKLLILYPNFLISGTTIVSSIRCKRKTVLNELFKRGMFAKPLLLGNIMHEIFTTCFQNRNFSRSFFLENYRNVCKNVSHLESFYALDISPDMLAKEIEQYISPVARIGGALLGKFPSKPLEELNVHKLVCEQVERNAWAPSVGLKGKMDVIAVPQSTSEDTKVILELKTGKDSNSIEHQDQVRLYGTIMKSEKISNCSKGALVYLKSGNIYPVKDQSISLRELVIIRNILVYYLTQSGLRKVKKGNENTIDMKDIAANLPDLEEDQFNCANCEQRFNCGLMSRLTGSKNSEKGKVPNLTELHADSYVVTPSHLKFFSKWHSLCLMEFPISPEPEYAKMWMEPFEELVKKGLTEGNLVLVSQIKAQLDDSVLVTFEKSTTEHLSNLLEGDRVLISSQCLSVINIASGTVSKVANRKITIIVEQEITVGQQSGSSFSHWRLDKPSQETTTSSTLSIMLSNLSQLMTQSGNSRVKRLRELILDNEDAAFEETDKHLIPTELRPQAKAILCGLNGQQKLAVRKVLMSHDYTVIRGMPGSGKTTVIVAVIRLLVLCGHRILLTSFTNAAVDNVLLKLKKLNNEPIKMVRLGVKSRVHADLHCFLPGANGLSYNAVASQFDNANVIAGTVFNVHHPIFSGSKRKFNFCVVDEASQILLPLCIGPLFAAQRFVLVGDEHQLAPLVSNEKAKREGLAESLFEYIASRNNKAVFSLSEQYRMNESIMVLSNKLSYNGQMKAANAKVAERALDVKFQMSCNKECCNWLNSSFDPKNAAVFIDTSKSSERFEAEKNNSYFNILELNIVQLLLKVLQGCSVPMQSIGVICPYRQQLIQAQAKFGSLGPEFEGLEVHTVDKFQGRDKDVIILTCVRSKKKHDVGIDLSSQEQKQETRSNELLNDTQRVNVAVSRAKSKLILIGDLSTLESYDPMKVIVDILTNKRCVFTYTDHKSDNKL